MIPDLRDAPLFLVGFMGSGKTTVGRALALRRGAEFADTDAMVERALGRSIEEIFLTWGEGRFREAEWDALRSFAGEKGTVVATGGGLFLAVASRAFVRAHGVSIWLDVPLEVARARVAGAHDRPLWTRGDALEDRAFYERRRAAYALADIRADATPEDPACVAKAIEERLRTLRR